MEGELVSTDHTDRPLSHLDKHPHRELAFLHSPGTPKIVLAGNPNVGKSLIFNRMSGLYVDVSNFPGTTVEVIRGKYSTFDVFDTPGIYGLSALNDEECVARDVILEADIVLNVVDGTHLERDLFLTQQLIDMGKKLTVLLNFMDEVDRLGIAIDVEKLSHFLGVEVIPVSAVRGIGDRIIEQAIREAREGVQRQELHSNLHAMLRVVGSQAEALLVLEGDEVVAERHGIEAGRCREEIYIERRNRINYIVSQVVSDQYARSGIGEMLGRWSLQPLTGIPLLLGILYVAYLFVGKLVAQDLVGFTEGIVGRQLWEPWIRNLVGRALDSTSWLTSLLVGEFGVITMTTTYLVFLLLPLVASFYLLLAMVEDSGYLPRLATMADHALGFLGLNGRAVIPIILGFGCITSATITTRVLSSDREKTIATALLQFAIPCSAQMAVIAALLAGAGYHVMILYVLIIVGVLVAIGTLLNRTLKGEPEPLLLDLPPIRFPRFGNVLQKTWFRTSNFMKEAAGWFFLGALAVGLARETGTLDVLQGLLRPITTQWLQLPPETATAFVMGIVRRDFGAAGLYTMSLSPMEALVALVTITLFVPCIASLMVMLKERGFKQGMIIWMGTWVAAFLVGGIISQLLI
jgi:ferrous iron transport protein B